MTWVVVVSVLVGLMLGVLGSLVAPSISELKGRGPMTDVLRSRQFWIAVVALVQAILFNRIPNFPPEIWQAALVLAGVMIAKLTVDDAAMYVGRAIGMAAGLSENQARDLGRPGKQ